MTVGIDFQVRRRDQDQVSALAAEWRKAAPEGAKANRFDIARFLEKTVLPSLAKQGRQFTLKVTDDDPTLPEGWVDFERMELCFQSSIWAAALEQEEFARLVLAHEIGHLILHGDQVFSFSRGLEVKLNYLEPSQSAECQANWFASALLLPDDTLRKLSRLDDYSIATLTLVDEHVVAIRRKQFEMNCKNRRYTGDACPACHGFSVAIEGSARVCQECGKEIAE